MEAETPADRFEVLRGILESQDSDVLRNVPEHVFHFLRAYRSDDEADTALVDTVFGSVLWKGILDPAGTESRTRSLSGLLERVQRESSPEIPSDVLAFLRHGTLDDESDQDIVAEILDELAWQDILGPLDEGARTEALRWALKRCHDEDPPQIPAEVMKFLETYITQHKAQAAIIGLILDSKISSKLDVPGSVLWRIFPILHDPTEPDLIRLAVDALKLRSPETVYRQAGMLTAESGAPKLDFHYAFEVIGTIPFKTLKGRFTDYVPP